MIMQLKISFCFKGIEKQGVAKAMKDRGRCCSGHEQLFMQAKNLEIDSFTYLIRANFLKTANRLSSIDATLPHSCCTLISLLLFGESVYCRNSDDCRRVRILFL